MKMFNLKIFLSLFLLFLAVCALGQRKNLDALYLKNGSVLKGEIIELVFNQKVVFRLSNSQIIELPYQEIERIVKDGWLPNEDNAGDNSGAWSERGANPGNEKFKGLSYFIVNASVGRLTVERKGEEGLNPRNRGYQMGFEVGAQALNMFSRRWGLGVGLQLSNYTAEIPYYADAARSLVRYRNQDFYYVNIPFYFRLMTGRPETISLYLDLGFEPAVSFSAKEIREAIEINRMNLNFLFGIGARIPFNETISASVGFRSLSGMTNAGWSDYLSQFSLQYSALQAGIMLQPRFRK